jgi:glutamyl-tRNA reductase
MKYAAIVYSHKNIETKELYDYDIPDSILEKRKGIEYVMLKTCNRIELYLSSNNAERDAKLLLKELCIYKPGYGKGKLYTGKEAVKHAFYVASGLDSIVLGENEILGQVKSAYTNYINSGKAGARLKNLFNNAVKTGRKVRTETEINKGKMGIYSLAIDYIDKSYNNEEIAIIGSGDEAKRFLKGFSTKRNLKGKVFSREIKHARDIAVKYGMDYGIFNLDEIKKYKTVFCAYKSTEKFKLKEPKLIVDISVPHIFEGKNVLHIEDLAAKAGETLNRRKEAAKMAEKITLSKVDDFIDVYGE